MTNIVKNIGNIAILSSGNSLHLKAVSDALQRYGPVHFALPAREKERKM